MVGTQAEYSCLLRYGNTQGYSSWFWTDGISYTTEDRAQKPFQYRIINHQISYFFLAHTDEYEIWVHALDNSDVTWFSPKWTCHADANFHAGGGDAFIIHLGGTTLSGSYCDTDKTSHRKFICEKHQKVKYYQIV